MSCLSSDWNPSDGRVEYSFPGQPSVTSCKTILSFLLSMGLSQHTLQLLKNYVGSCRPANVKWAGVKPLFRKLVTSWTSQSTAPDGPLRFFKMYLKTQVFTYDLLLGRICNFNRKHVWVNVLNIWKYDHWNKMSVQCQTRSVCLLHSDLWQGLVGTRSSPILCLTLDTTTVRRFYRIEADRRCRLNYFSNIRVFVNS